VNRLLTTIRKEKIGALHRAKRSNVNSLGGDAGGDQLIAIGSVQIDPRMPGAGRLEE
jgi:hypothetical protein